MITTRTGIKIVFVKRDERVVQMVVSIPHTTGDKIVASPKLTIGDLKQEIAALELDPKN